MQNAQGGVQDTVRDDLDRRRNKLTIFPTRIYAPPVRMTVKVSTDGVIDQPVVGFGNDVMIGSTPVAIPPK